VRTTEREWLSAEERSRVVEFFNERFGLPEKCFTRRNMYQASRQRIYLVSEDLANCSIDVVAGINLARLGAALKPTTDFLQLHSELINKNVLHLTAEQARCFVLGEEVVVGDENLREFSNGYLCLKYADQALGCAHFKNGALSNLLSKDRRRKLEYL